MEESCERSMEDAVQHRKPRLSLKHTSNAILFKHTILRKRIECESFNFHQFLRQAIVMLVAKCLICFFQCEDMSEKR